MYKYIGTYTVYIHIDTLHMVPMRYMQNKSTCINNNTSSAYSGENTWYVTDSVIAGTKMLEQRRINVDVERRWLVVAPTLHVCGNILLKIHNSLIIE